MTCRDCALWDIDAAKDKIGRVLSSRYVKCFWESKEQYPLSVYERANQRPHTSYMSANDGHRCPFFIKRED